MKKIFCISLFSLLLSAVLPLGAQVKVGIVGGMNVSKLSFDRNVYSSDNRYGWFLGPKLYVKVPLIGLGLDAALEYNTRRLNVKSRTDEPYATDDSKTLQTVEIPINVRYTMGLGDVASVFLATGPQFGFNVGHKRLSDYTRLKDSNVTWNIGAGVRLLSHVEIGAGYNFALGKFGNTLQGGEDRNKNDFKAGSWQINAAYIF